MCSGWDIFGGQADASAGGPPVAADGFGYLIPAVFLERPNRFGAWVALQGRREYVHVPDPGRLRELLVPGTTVWLRPAVTQGRRTAFSLVMTQANGEWVSLDTGVPNRVVRRALERGELPEFSGYATVQPELTYGRSRLDFLLAGASGRCLLEVKSVTLVVDGCGLFPDAVSERASRHLRELIGAVADGYRAVALFVAQRQDARCVAPNEVTDPYFAQTLRQAADAGVELLARLCRVHPAGIEIGSPIPVSPCASRHRQSPAPRDWRGDRFPRHPSAVLLLSACPPDQQEKGNKDGNGREPAENRRNLLCSYARWFRVADHGSRGIAAAHRQPARHVQQLALQRGLEGEGWLHGGQRALHAFRRAQQRHQPSLVGVGCAASGSRPIGQAHCLVLSHGRQQVPLLVIAGQRRTAQPGSIRCEATGRSGAAAP
ncbi:MAG: DNA/RNA nuclease SfsA [Chloroflexota bacterium]|nr:DNA/RNA nuclease SfsA [Chloroflexota bacterium]